METKIETVIETRTERLKRAIQELRQVDMDVLFPSADSGVEDRAEEDRLLFELKGIVDEVRTSIWCRFKATAESDQDAQKMVDFYRMRRVVQMLRQVATNSNMPKLAQHMSEVRDLKMSAETVVETHGSNNTIH